jgi:glycosyltransferase involved in cell wall biosynthesis
MFSNSGIHNKNRRGLELMCLSLSIHLEFTDQLARLQNADYSILIINSQFIEPSQLPSSIKIIYGPQFWPQSLQGHYQPEYEKQYVYNSLSLWNQYAQLEIYGSLRTPIVQFPYAVDIDRFKITKESPSYDCLVYMKHRTQTTYNQVFDILKSKQMSYTIIQYGSYSESQYIDALKRSKFVLAVDAHESQGFALEEAMSCDVPLLVLNATSLYDESLDGKTSIYEHHRPKTLVASSVPYWSDECGIKIENIQDLSDSLTQMLDRYTTFTPREYILRTLAPKPCMQRILDYFGL